MIYLRINAPFPGSLMGLRIGDDDRSLKNKKDYEEQYEMGSIKMEGSTLSWRTADGRIVDFIRVNDPKWEVKGTF